MVHLLLVANKTLASGEVSRFVRERIAQGDSCEFTLLVPAIPHRTNWDLGWGTRLRTPALEHECRMRLSAWTIGNRHACGWSTG